MDNNMFSLQCFIGIVLILVFSFCLVSLLVIEKEREYSSEQKLSLVRKYNNEIQRLHNFYSNQINSF